MTASSHPALPPRGMAIVWCAAVTAVLFAAFPLRTASGILIIASLVYVVITNSLFAVEGYLTILAGYYWLGIVDPFGAEIHGITLSDRTMRAVFQLVVLGGLLLWAGALLGRMLWRQGARFPPERPVDPDRLARVYRVSVVFLVAGCFVATLCYLKYGVPALATFPDLARTEFVGRLSPFTYYQWLLVEVGIGLGVLAIAQDRDPKFRARRVRLVLVMIAALLVVSGVVSRVMIGTPLVLAAVVWWSQGRHFKWYANLLGMAGAIAVIAVVWLLRVQALGQISLYGVDLDFAGGVTGTIRTVAAGTSIFARTSVEAFGLFVQGYLPHLHGEISFMSVISLLPGRHPGLGLFRVSQLLGYDPESGTTVSLFGGMYGDFGTPGVLIASPLVGFALGSLEALTKRADRLGGILYAVTLSYYFNMIYGGQLLDVTLLWKLWLALLAMHYCRTGKLVTSRLTSACLVVTAGLYGFGILKLFTA